MAVKYVTGLWTHLVYCGNNTLQVRLGLFQHHSFEYSCIRLLNYSIIAILNETYF